MGVPCRIRARGARHAALVQFAHQRSERPAASALGEDPHYPRRGHRVRLQRVPAGPTSRAWHSGVVHRRPVGIRRAGGHRGTCHAAGFAPASPPSRVGVRARPHGEPGRPAAPSVLGGPGCPAQPGHRLPATPAHPPRSAVPPRPGTDHCERPARTRSTLHIVRSTRSWWESSSDTARCHARDISGSWNSRVDIRP
jgi:hypothetical protein